jgi:hypothetical protein
MGGGGRGCYPCGSEDLLNINVSTLKLSSKHTENDIFNEIL